MASSNEVRDRIVSMLRSARFLLPTAVFLSLFSLWYTLFAHEPITHSIGSSQIVAQASAAFSSPETSPIQNATLGVGHLPHIPRFD